MKDNWNELFDNMKEEDILRNLPEDLPEMEDELAAKRIENRVMQEIRIDMGLQKKWKRKRILAAAVGCVAVVGLFGHKPIMAAFERLFHDLPGVGVYINEEDKTIYEVQIDNPVQEQNGIRVELCDFYFEDNFLHGFFEFTGEGLEVIEFSEDESVDTADVLKEKFQITYYFGDQERIMYAPRTGYMEEDGKIIRHTRTFEEAIPIKQGYFEYEIAITGFDRRFHLKLVDPKTVETPDELGYSQTLNDTTITARASVVDDMIEMEYYIIPSDEVKLAQENRNRYYTGSAPYQFDWDDVQYVETAKGERLKQEEYRYLRNGVKCWYKGSEKDFPLKFHYPILTGSDMESYTFELTLPKDGEKITKNLPKLNFHYGTVEILSVTKEFGEYDNRDMINPKISSATVVDIVYRVTPKDGERQMYNINLSPEEEFGILHGSEGLDSGDDYYMHGERYYLADMEKETLQLKFHMPSFWIVGDYDIVIEKPVYGQNNASAIDVESDVEDEYFNIG